MVYNFIFIFIMLHLNDYLNALLMSSQTSVKRYLIKDTDGIFFLIGEVEVYGLCKHIGKKRI